MTLPTKTCGIVLVCLAGKATGSNLGVGVGVGLGTGPLVRTFSRILFAVSPLDHFTSPDSEVCLFPFVKHADQLRASRLLRGGLFIFSILPGW